MLKPLLFKINIILWCVVIVGCAKKNNKKLAQNYYNLGIAELSGVVNSRGEEILAYKRTLDYIDKALEQASSAECLALKATLLFRLKKHEESEVFFKLALKEKMALSLKGEILNNYACLLAHNNKKQDALTIWKRLIKDEYYLTPEVAYVNQARLFESMNKYVVARDCFLKAIELAPDYLDAHYYLALLAQKYGDIPLAKNSISSALYLEPQSKEMRLVAQRLGININKTENGFNGNVNKAEMT
jgi:Tfp pilus assembly protein PilF